MKSALMLASLAIVLTGCGKSPEPPKSAAPVPSTTPVPAVQVSSSSDPASAAFAHCNLSATPVQNLKATVTEADLGVPLYPGAKLNKGMVSSSPDGSGAYAEQETNDPPQKVLAFYRDRLKAQAAGRELVDTGGPNRDGNSLLELEAAVGKPGIQIITTGDNNGSALSIGTTCIVK